VHGPRRHGPQSTAPETFEDEKQASGDGLEVKSESEVLLAVRIRSVL
jgi:hypothetical protein